MSRRSLYAALIALAFVGLLTYGLIAKGSSGPEVGGAVPATELVALDDEPETSLDDFRGRWVLVNFWASWCEPCKEESPALQELQDRFGGEDFTVIGIATRDVSDDSRDFARDFELSYPQFRDGDGKIAQDWGTTGVPESFLVDPEGKLRVKHPGAVNEEMIESQFASVLEANGVTDRQGGAG
jgi:cytochrome c biogenesis protein CcmG/thiol:disulfide interchange protein DsbE